MTPIERLRGLLIRAAAGQPDAAAIADAAATVFGAWRRTDMRSGVATIIRRLAQLAANGSLTISAEGWDALHEATALFDRPDLGPGDVATLDERLRAIGLDVERVQTSSPHVAGPQHPN